MLVRKVTKKTENEHFAKIKTIKCKPIDESSECNKLIDELEKFIVENMPMSDVSAVGVYYPGKEIMNIHFISKNDFQLYDQITAQTEQGIDDVPYIILARTPRFYLYDPNEVHFFDIEDVEDYINDKVG